MAESRTTVSSKSANVHHLDERPLSLFWMPEVASQQTAPQQTVSPLWEMPNKGSKLPLIMLL